MKDKAVLLLIAKKDTCHAFKDELEMQTNLQVVVAAPPTELLDLPLLITQHHAKAVIIEQDLESHSEVTYMGIDALRLSSYNTRFRLYHFMC